MGFCLARPPYFYTHKTFYVTAFTRRADKEEVIKGIMSLVSVICVKGSPPKAYASWHVYSFPRAVIRKYNNPGDLKHQKCIIWGGRSWEIGTDTYILLILHVK